MCAALAPRFRTALVAVLVGVLPRMTLSHPCTDEASPSMANASVGCGSWIWGVQSCDRCSEFDDSAELKYCQYSCYIAGCGYPGDHCTSNASASAAGEDGTADEELEVLDWMPFGISPLFALLAGTALVVLCVVTAFWFDWKQTEAQKKTVASTQGSAAVDSDPEAQKMGKAEAFDEVEVAQVAAAVAPQQQQQQQQQAEEALPPPVSLATIVADPAHEGELSETKSMQAPTPLCADGIVLEATEQQDVHLLA